MHLLDLRILVVQNSLENLVVTGSSRAHVLERVYGRLACRWLVSSKRRRKSGEGKVLRTNTRPGVYRIMYSGKPVVVVVFTGVCYDVVLSLNCTHIVYKYSLHLSS
jgi:hypothetical protein